MAEKTSSIGKLMRWEDPSSAPTGYVIYILTVLVVITVIALQAYFGSAVASEEQKKIYDRTPGAYKDLRANQEAEIADYRWVNEEAGQVAVPIERALELTAESMQD